MSSMHVGGSKVSRPSQLHCACAGTAVKMPMFGTIAEALLQPKRFRWCTGIVLQPYVPWTFPGTPLHSLQLMPGLAPVWQTFLGVLDGHSQLGNALHALHAARHSQCLSVGDCGPLPL